MKSLQKWSAVCCEAFRLVRVVDWSALLAFAEEGLGAGEWETRESALQLLLLASTQGAEVGEGRLALVVGMVENESEEEYSRETAYRVLGATWKSQSVAQKRRVCRACLCLLAGRTESVAAWAALETLGVGMKCGNVGATEVRESGAWEAVVKSDEVGVQRRLLSLLGALKLEADGGIRVWVSGLLGELVEEVSLTEQLRELVCELEWKELSEVRHKLSSVPSKAEPSSPFRSLFEELLLILRSPFDVALDCY